MCDMITLGNNFPVKCTIETLLFRVQKKSDRFLLTDFERVIFILLKNWG